MNSPTDTKKTKIFITIDTEDTHFDIPRLITGQGLEGNPGISMIMDMLDRYKLRGNFFFNAYEHVNYKSGLLGNIAASISERGHEVDLHTHPNRRLSYYKRPLYQNSLEEQINILKYGRDLIHSWTGVQPIAHRGGNYSCNDDTLAALSKLGISIDSSRWFNNPSNFFKENFTVNRVTCYKDTIEVPVTYICYKKSQDTHIDSKLDINWLNLNSLIKAVQLAKENNLKTLTLFLHSFSFIKKNKVDNPDFRDPKAIFINNPDKGSRHMEITGVDKNIITAFDKLLDYISGDKDLDVLTFREWYNSGEYMADPGDDYIPVIER